jgi:hypothetical protein
MFLSDVDTCKCYDTKMFEIVLHATYDFGPLHPVSAYLAWTQPQSNYAQN